MRIYKIKVSQITGELLEFEDLHMSEWSVSVLNKHKSIRFKYPPFSSTESHMVKGIGKAILYFDGCPNYHWNFIVDLDNPNQLEYSVQIGREEKFKQLNIF
jgi:hypothetical protein